MTISNPKPILRINSWYARITTNTLAVARDPCLVLPRISFQLLHNSITSSSFMQYWCPKQGAFTVPRARRVLFRTNLKRQFQDDGLDQKSDVENNHHCSQRLCQSPALAVHCCYYKNQHSKENEKRYKYIIRTDLSRKKGRDTTG